MRCSRLDLPDIEVGHTHNITQHHTTLHNITQLTRRHTTLFGHAFRALFVDFSTAVCSHVLTVVVVCAFAEFAGESSKCVDRIHWTKNNVFGSKVRACWWKPAAVCLICLMAFVEPATLTRQANACELAYSKVQVECDICRACSIQDSPMHPCT